MTASVVAHKLEEHNSNHYEEHHDETDSFNNGFGTPQLPGARVEKDGTRLLEYHSKFHLSDASHCAFSGGFRNRTQTMDSLASLAESRFGDFDVQDDSGHFKVRIAQLLKFFLGLDDQHLPQRCGLPASEAKGLPSPQCTQP